MGKCMRLLVCGYIYIYCDLAHADDEKSFYFLLYKNHVFERFFYNLIACHSDGKLNVFAEVTKF